VSTAFEQPRLLLVEDDRHLVEMLTRLLAEESYQVDVASDGHRGLPVLAATPDSGLRRALIALLDNAIRHAATAARGRRFLWRLGDRRGRR
jgi:DNA-binding response OmpR family regulator